MTTGRRGWSLRGVVLGAVAVVLISAMGGAAPRVRTVSDAADPVIAVAGDIACDPSSPDFNGGNGTSAKCRELATSDLLTGGNLSAVLTLGDNQYWCGGASAFQQSYDPSWGRVLSITYPVPGNHEYRKAANTPNGTDCASTHKAPGYYGYYGRGRERPGRVGTASTSGPGT